MKIVAATLRALRIPLRAAFQHALKQRRHSDAIVLELVTDAGVRGYGEGVARPYVTGETVAQSMAYLDRVLVPVIMEQEWTDVQPGHYDLLQGHCKATGEICHASGTAVELALVDCWLKEQGQSLAHWLPPKTSTVVYSAVLSGGNLEQTLHHTRQAKALGMQFLKIKVGDANDIQRIARAREIVGPRVSIRLDANGAFDVKGARGFIEAAKRFDIDTLEQPIPKGDISGLAAIRRDSPIPIMADESIVTWADAQALIGEKACDYFNLRLSKNGGLFNTLRLAALAQSEGIGVQLGCQVGETAILSAAGRHVAAALGDLRFVEGSYGEFLLQEDIAQEPLQFGDGGRAGLMAGPGLGISVCRDRLAKYAVQTIAMGKAGR